VPFRHLGHPTRGFIAVVRGRWPDAVELIVLNRVSILEGSRKHLLTARQMAFRADEDLRVVLDAADFGSSWTSSSELPAVAVASAKVKE
jgi:hypothetical protein